jgi:hypothetical protein
VLHHFFVCFVCFVLFLPWSFDYKSLMAFEQYIKKVHYCFITASTLFFAAARARDRDVTDDFRNNRKMVMPKKLFESDRPNQTTPAADNLPDGSSEESHTTSSTATRKPLFLFFEHRKQI